MSLLIKTKSELKVYVVINTKTVVSQSLLRLSASIQRDAWAKSQNINIITCRSSR